MNTEIPSQAVVAIATVIAALITGVIAMVNLTLGKEQKITEMRQAWIDGLREDLAKFFAGYRFVSSAVEDTWDRDASGVASTHSASSEQVAEQAAVIAETIYRIKLRLNPSEQEHIELERLLNEVVRQYEAIPNGSSSLRETTLTAIDRANNQARKVLKLEWERVKRGEKAFSTLRKWVAPTIVAVMSIFVAVILLAKFRT